MTARVPMLEAHILGVDPGTTTGFAHLVTEVPVLPDPKWRPGAVPLVKETGEWENVGEMRSWLVDWDSWTGSQAALLVGVEAFIAGSNQRHGRGQKSLQDPLGMIQALHEKLNGLRSNGRAVFVVQRSASTVKRWATTKRLFTAQYLDGGSMSTHEVDALRHGLYAACHTGIARDPLAPAPVV